VLGIKFASRGVPRGQWGEQCIGAEKPNNVASTFFNTVHLLPKDLRFEYWGVKTFLPLALSNLVTPLCKQDILRTDCALPSPSRQPVSLTSMDINAEYVEYS